jgi:hypothetical protein
LRYGGLTLLYSEILKFYLISFFCPRTPHYLESSHRPKPLLILVAFLSLFLLTLTVLKNILENVSWDLSHFFIKIGVQPTSHTCNPSYLGSNIGRIVVPGQPRQIVCETLSQSIAGCVPVIPVTVVQGSLGKKRTSISKITRTKRARGMPQAVEHLPCKREALSSNSSPTKKKNNNNPSSPTTQHQVPFSKTPFHQGHGSSDRAPA